MVKSYATKAIMPGLIPTLFVAIGSTVGATLKLPAKVSGSLVTVAAGLITASFISDTAPEIADTTGRSSRVSAMLGMMGGILLMIGLQYAENRTGNNDHGRGSVWGLVGGSCIKFFTDSVLVGQSIKDNDIPTTPMMIAISIESVVISSAIATTMRNRGKSNKEIAGFVIALVFSSALGIFAGFKFKKFFSGSREMFMLGVAATVMLWVVVYELLPEANRSLSAKKWVIPALWLGSTAVGIGSKWI
jgi:zinc transporter ZupT